MTFRQSHIKLYLILLIRCSSRHGWNLQSAEGCGDPLDSILMAKMVGNAKIDFVFLDVEKELGKIG